MNKGKLLMFKNKKKQSNQRKTSIITAIFVIMVISIFSNSNTLLSQSFREVNFPDGSMAGMESIVKTNISYRIYQTSPNVIKFDLPSVSFVKVGLYDSKNTLVRTYIYNNLTAGTYEININSINIEKGNYTCVLSTADAEESSQVVIE